MIDSVKRLVGLSKVAMRTDGDTLVIFVHGLGGSAFGTWRQMLKVFSAEQSLEHVAFDCYSYPTSLIRIPFLSRRPGIRELANGLQTYIHAHHAEKRKILLVGHSLGGLVVRQYILDILDTEEGKKLAGALLYAVPNNGSAWAYINSTVSWHHLQAKQLQPSSDFLDNINKEWVRRNVDLHLPISYVIGGLDAVVARESSAWSQGGEHQTVIEHGHRTIIKPKTNGETSFKLLQKFIQRTIPVLVNQKKKETREIEGIHSFNADPLFDIYSVNVEPFYAVRDIDKALLQATISAHIWVSGLSGVGKTASLKRLATVSKWQLEHVILSSFQNKNATALIAAVCNQLYERIGMPEVIVQSNVVLEDILMHLEKIYQTLDVDKVLAIFVEEIPIPPGAEYARFLEIIYHITLLTERMGGNRKVIWMFSSINDPGENISPQLKHFRERMQFIKLERWTDIEMRRLIAKIKSSGLISISANNAKILITEAKGIPRFVKMVLRRSRNETGSRKPFSELITSVEKDLN